ncbi:polyprenyl synthetase family protein [Kitasatospora sp. NPDC088779]
MTARTLGSESPDLTVVRTQVDGILDGFLTAKARAATARYLPGEIPRILHDFLSSGGKRLRPLLCVTGWRAAGGEGDPRPVLRVAASLEMFHAFALIHDDIMDRSTTRRGHPTVHRALATLQREGRSEAAADDLGVGSAILVGDLALAWSDELLHTAGLTPGRLVRILPLIDAMRTEVMYGQYLDLASTGHPTDDVDRALAIIHYKTAKYTCERPLQIGATLAGADDELRTVLSDFALPLGEAFQLRDDLLGVYGDPDRTGKPTLDDLRDGKHTTLAALALKLATPDQVARLRRLLGDPDLTEEQAEDARRVITATGARDMVEQMIRARCAQADHALSRSTIPPAVAATLRELARAATKRTT